MSPGAATGTEPKVEAINSVVAAWSGAAGGIAAIIAVGVSVFQIQRDRERERRQAVARARTAKLLIGAAYATVIGEVRGLQASLAQPGSRFGAQGQAESLRDNRQFGVLLQALLTLDVTALSETAQRPVGDAQAALIGLGNQIASHAKGGRFEGDADQLGERVATVMRAFETMRGEVPFELEPGAGTKS